MQQIKEMSCPLCYEKVYSELSKGCKLCGMPLEDESKEFCSRICREEYRKINRKVNILLTQSLNSSL